MTSFIIDFLSRRQLIANRIIRAIHGERVSEIRLEKNGRRILKLAFGDMKTVTIFG